MTKKNDKKKQNIEIEPLLDQCVEKILSKDGFIEHKMILVASFQK